MTTTTAVPLSSLGLIVTGSTPPSSHPEWFSHEGMPFITPSDILNDKWVRTSRFLSEVGAAELARRIIPANSVCFVSIGSTIGKMCSTTVPSVTNQQINSLVVDPDHGDPTYIYYAISEVSSTLRAIAGGSATPILNKSAFSSVQIDILPVKEQRAVGRFLDVLDAKIESNRRAVETGESLLRSIVEKTLETSDGKQGLLGDYCSLIQSTVKSKEIDESTHYIGFEHMPRGSIFLDEWEPAIGLGSNKSAFAAGDILFGKLRPYFKKVGIVPVAGICSTDILVIRAKRADDALLVASVAASNALIDSLSASSTGTRMPRASWRDLAAWPVPILDQDEREALVATTKHVHEKLERLTFESKTLFALRDLLLPELLSGRISAPNVLAVES